MTDATLIAADASLNSLVHNDPQQAQKEVEAQRQRRGTIDGQAQRKLSNQTHRSRTDPDATLAQKQGTPRQLKYKVHQTIDADSRIILDTEVTTGGRHDNQPYLEQLAAGWQNSIRLRFMKRLLIGATVRQKSSRHSRSQGTETYIPLWNRRSGRNSGAAVGLEYEREHDRIRCAAGKYLYPSAGDYWNRTRYSSSPGQCRDCPLASTCAAKNRPKCTTHAVRVTPC